MLLECQDILKQTATRCTRGTGNTSIYAYLTIYYYVHIQKIFENIQNIYIYKNIQKIYIYIYIKIHENIQKYTKNIQKYIKIYKNIKKYLRILKNI